MLACRPYYQFYIILTQLSISDGSVHSKILVYVVILIIDWVCDSMFHYSFRHWPEIIEMCGGMSHLI